METDFARMLHKFMQYAQEWVTLLDGTNMRHRLQNAGPDVWALVEKADVFWLARTPYSRAQLARLMREQMWPGNVTQIG